MKVLIVDDNPQARWMMKHYLRELSDEFRECENGTEVVAAYTEFLPDWVLIDWEIKQVGGLSATQNVIVLFPDAKILIITNYDEQDLRQAAFEAGAISYFCSKPPRINPLLHLFSLFLTKILFGTFLFLTS